MSNDSDTVPSFKETPSFQGPSSLNIALLGTGLFGRSLASHISSYAPQHSLTVASRSSSTTPAEAASSADIVILAVPAAAHASVLHSIAANLRPRTIVVDVSNFSLRVLPHRKKSESPAVKLARDVPEGVRVVKAFNTLSAQLLSSRAAKDSPVPFAADENAVSETAAFISSLGFSPRHFGPLATAASELEALPHTLFPSLRGPVILSMIVWAWWILYSLFSSYIIHGSDGEPSRPWEKAPLSVLMASTAETAMTLFAVTFLAGPLARLVQLARGSVSKPFGKLFSKWLDARKELGLVAFVFVSAHGIAGAISKSHLDDGWQGSLYFVFGIVYVGLTLWACGVSLFLCYPAKHSICAPELV